MIGAGEHATGAWLSVEDVGFPDECREVWGEAAKDMCFRRAARRRILEHPGVWLGLVPAKLSHTFDYGDAPGWYLHTSNADAFPELPRALLFGWELLWLRFTAGALLLGLAARGAGGSVSRCRVRRALALIGAPFLFLEWLWPAYVVILVLLALFPRRPPALQMAFWTLGTTLMTHAVFFGATRYALVTTPALVVAAIGALTLQGRRGDTGAEENLDAADRN